MISYARGRPRAFSLAQPGIPSEAAPRTPRAVLSRGTKARYCVIRSLFPFLSASVRFWRAWSAIFLASWGAGGAVFLSLLLCGPPPPNVPRRAAPSQGTGPLVGGGCNGASGANPRPAGGWRAREAAQTNDRPNPQPPRCGRPLFVRERVWREVCEARRPEAPPRGGGAVTAGSGAFESRMLCEPTGRERTGRMKQARD